MSRHCTSGRPASIIVANWRVKITRSLVLTLGLQEREQTRSTSRDFSLTETGMQHLRAQLRHHGRLVDGLHLALLDRPLPGPALPRRRRASSPRPLAGSAGAASRSRAQPARRTAGRAGAAGRSCLRSSSGSRAARHRRRRARSAAAGTGSRATGSSSACRTSPGRPASAE